MLLIFFVQLKKLTILISFSFNLFLYFIESKFCAKVIEEISEIARIDIDFLLNIFICVFYFIGIRTGPETYITK